MGRWKNWCQKIELKPKTGEDIVLAVDKKGEILTSSQNQMIGKKLDEVLGKGLADKIMAKESGTLSGEGLKFGGEWASNLYDRQVKNIVEKMTGQRVEMLDMGLPVDNLKQDFQIQHFRSDGKYTLEKLTKDKLKIGLSVSDKGAGGETGTYIITDILGDGKFKAVPKSSVESPYSDWKEMMRLNPQLENLKETFDISQKTTQQQAIKLTPEVKNKIKGIAPKIKTSGKMFEEKPQTKTSIETPAYTQAEKNTLKTIENIHETTTKKILTSTKETPIEFGLGKGVVQEKIISNESSRLNDLLKKAKITKEESLELFNAFDNPKKYKLSQTLKNKGGDDIIKEGRKLNSFLSEQKLSRNIIDRVYDDETYLRTVLETLDGGKPTAEQVARLKNATNQTFRDQLARDLTGFSGKLREKIKTDIRKYKTADERDVVLESFGLRTKRDFVNSMSENIRLTTRATSNKEFNDAVRGIAKDGFWVKGKKLVKRDDIIEAYDPFVVSKTRQEIKNNTSKKISKIVDEIKEERILTENEAKNINVEFNFKAKE